MLLAHSVDTFSLPFDVSPAALLLPLFAFCLLLLCWFWLLAHPTADAVVKARATWCRDVADVLLHIILVTNNSQRMRSTAINALNTLSKLQDVHVGVWLSPVLEHLQPPLMARRFVPVKVGVVWCV